MELANSIIKILLAFTTAGGIILIGSALWGFKSADQSSSVIENIVRLLAGAVLMSVSSFYIVIKTTFIEPDWQATPASALAIDLSVLEGEDATGLGAVIPKEMGENILIFLFIVGLIGIIKGIMMARLLGQTNQMGQQTSFGKVATFVISGALLMNIPIVSCWISELTNISMVCMA